MHPAYRIGDIAYLGEESINDPDTNVGNDCVCELEDGRKVLRLLMPSGLKDHYNLEAYNAQPMTSVRVVSARPVIGIRRRIERDGSSTG